MDYKTLLNEIHEGLNKLWDNAIPPARIIINTKYKYLLDEVIDATWGYYPILDRAKVSALWGVKVECAPLQEDIVYIIDTWSPIDTSTDT